MALIVDLKKGEKFIIGDTVIINDTHNRKFTNGGARLYITGDAPMLRGKDIMEEQDAISPARKMYFVVQQMFLARDSKPFAATYSGLLRQIQEATPEAVPYCEKINNMIQSGSYYKALKEAKQLVAYEQSLPVKDIPSPT